MGGKSSVNRNKTQPEAHGVKISHELPVFIESHSNMFRHGIESLVAEMTGRQYKRNIATDMYGFPAFLLNARVAYNENEILAVRLGDSTWIPPFPNNDKLAWRALVERVYVATDLAARMCCFAGKYPDQVIADLWLFVDGLHVFTCKLWMIPTAKHTGTDLDDDKSSTRASTDSPPPVLNKRFIQGLQGLHRQLCHLEDRLNPDFIQPITSSNPPRTGRSSPGTATQSAPGTRTAGRG